MVLINYTVREISTKIVYYGPGLSGKTTNLQIIHQKVNPDSRGKLVSLATETDRTLFFDFFPIDFGKIGGFKVRFHFYTVPGQVFYNSTRKLVLKGADGVVFVADSQRNMEDSNIESLINLKENLSEIGIDLDNDFPFVIQYNKRDLPDVLTIDELQKELNPNNVPYHEACAVKGDGIMETMKTISKIALHSISEQKGIGTVKKATKPVAKAEPAKSATQKVKEAIKAAKDEKDSDLSAPVAPSAPPQKSAAAPKQKEPEVTVEPKKEEPAKTESKAKAKTEPKVEPELKIDALHPTVISLDSSGKNVISEIILPEGFDGSEEISLPFVLHLPKDIGISKLNLNLSASYINKDGELLNPSEDNGKKKKKGKGLFGWRK